MNARHWAYICAVLFGVILLLILAHITMNSPGWAEGRSTQVVAEQPKGGTP